jgi:type I restriction enzyme M protein
MLDSETKRRIDTARDILVGKVPDPKSQVEQITIALIYKFMDDMDTESEELGGERSFFRGEYEKYAWRKIFDPRMGGFEILNLYSEAIVKMNLNPNIPQLFRDIFKNAYLPYRDPETLKAFLKSINEFCYDHSERLGDAFEYLLSVLGSQGDAGQFRTPRHIIDFMVNIIDPKKDEVIMDPACGTAGFLISSYKHILKHNSKSYDSSNDLLAFESKDSSLSEVVINGKNYTGDLLTPDERNRLSKNITGYDISPDMVRLSLVNMYLHGLRSPNIYEYDTLTSEERWSEYADVILANPPFMTPTGGIRPHKRFFIKSNRSEVLFVDYIIEHLSVGGKAAIIVPEGIIFQSGTAYKNLRRYLIEKSLLIAVVSLPAGMFNPYSQVKTSILFIDKNIAKKTNEILFVKINNDGTDLGARRLRVEENDLPSARKLIDDFIGSIGIEREDDFSIRHEVEAEIIRKGQILENVSFSLSINSYKTDKGTHTAKWPFIKISEFCAIEKGKSSSTKTLPGEFPLVLTAKERKTSDHFDFEGEAVLVPLISSTGHGKASLKTIHIQKGKFAAADLLGVIFPERSKCKVEFLFYCLDYIKDEIAKERMVGAANVSMKISDLFDIKIPLPPMPVQEKFVEEIENYQKIIDGAISVVQNYKPRIDIDPDWPMLELQNMAQIINGRAFKQEELLDRGKYPVLRVGNLFSNKSWYYSDMELDHDKYCDCGDLLFAWSASFGPKIWDGGKVIYHYHIWKIVNDPEIIDKRFLYYMLGVETERIKSEGGRGIAMIHITKEGMEHRKFPLPPLSIQNRIVEDINKEQSLIQGNRELIVHFEQKIKNRLAKVWSGG